MSETKFTKGDWAVQIEQLRNSKIEVFTVVSCDFDIISTDLCIRNEHDAHLIAAAPEMYAMLEGFLCLEGIIKTDEIKALLAKARGEL